MQSVMDLVCSVTRNTCQNDVFHVQTPTLRSGSTNTGCDPVVWFYFHYTSSSDVCIDLTCVSVCLRVCVCVCVCVCVVYLLQSVR